MAAVTVRAATASDVGGRSVNADAAAAMVTPLGAGVAVVDGIGSSQDVVAAARTAADAAAAVASHRGAQAGLMTAADTMPDYPGCPNAVAALVSVEPGGRVEIAHIGDAAVWTWTAQAGLRRWTVDQTAAEHITHLLGRDGTDDDERAALDQVADGLELLGDYVLNGLCYATMATISWTILRGEHAHPELVIVTSDGVHKVLDPDQITAQIATHHHDVHALADGLVAAAVTTDPDGDNATAAVLGLTWTSTT
uniref:hypothetical protein n=1 Tax=Actinokineospora sp. CA-119265 TaxID=3239890 RepID=UPI003F495770